MAANPESRRGDDRERAGTGTSERALLLFDDDLFAAVLHGALARERIEITRCRRVDEALAVLMAGARSRFRYIVMDADEYATEKFAVIPRLRSDGRGARVLVLAETDSAIKRLFAAGLAAGEVIRKPATSATVVAALLAPPPAARRPTISLDPAIICRTLAQYTWNISAAARALKVSRRTLQRRLAASTGAGARRN